MSSFPAFGQSYNLNGFRRHSTYSYNFLLPRTRNRNLSLVITNAKGEYYLCSRCGNRQYKKFYRCPNCKEADTMVLKQDQKSSSKRGGGAGSQLAREVDNESSETGGGQSGGGNELRALENMMGAWTSTRDNELKSTRTLKRAGFVSDSNRIKIPGAVGAEVNSVLGGGIVPGSAILITGNPGVGKSTLLLQIAGLLAKSREHSQSSYMSLEGFTEDEQQDETILYVSAEESQQQVGVRADRCGYGELDNLVLLHESNLNTVFEKGLKCNPNVIIIDSISTVEVSGVDSSVGGVSQVKECANAICQIAKARSIPIFMVCHVTKGGDLAGPKQLEHRVDVVLEIEAGESTDGLHILRARKNRFGSTQMVGLFQMEEEGFVAVSDPNEHLLTNWHQIHNNGSAVTVTHEGNRQLLLEIQALGAPLETNNMDSKYGRYGRQQQRRSVSSGGVASNVGLDKNNIYKVMGVLQCRAFYKVYDYKWYINVKGGIEVVDRGVDLALAVAMVSYIRHIALPRDLVCIGEVGLQSEVSSVKYIKARLQEAAKQGFTKAIVPYSKRGIGTVEGMKVIQCKTLRDALQEVFGNQSNSPGSQQQPIDTLETLNSVDQTDEDEEFKDDEFSDEVFE
eukprot:TRINITY_DN6430_c0_g4_i1.p1 TRINITY_DN6430_c0_g4~~TRINITY_DN6430_c0_g4_i1.p1  ORF type:complete len:623 (-),score=77.98 TRINITY_DN6430_c0_g4_i1:349-2217(-)